VTFRCKTLLIAAVLFFCLCINQYESRIPEDQQKIIRRILNQNGYSLSDKDFVDPYISKVLDFQTGAWLGQYGLLLPIEGNKKMILTDDINLLNANWFDGSVTYPYNSIADTILIETDSIIFIPSCLAFGEKFRSIPKNINKIRTRFLNARYNQLTSLPEEIMELTSPPFPYDTFAINIMGNPIDTTTLSDTLKRWLDRYSTSSSVGP